MSGGAKGKNEGGGNGDVRNVQGDFRRRVRLARSSDWEKTAYRRKTGGLLLRRIAVAETKARMDSANLPAVNERERAKAANRIIGDSLKEGETT